MHVLQLGALATQKFTLLLVRPTSSNLKTLIYSFYLSNNSKAYIYIYIYACYILTWIIFFFLIFSCCWFGSWSTLASFVLSPCCSCCTCSLVWLILFARRRQSEPFSHETRQQIGFTSWKPAAVLWSQAAAWTTSSNESLSLSGSSKLALIYHRAPVFELFSCIYCVFGCVRVKTPFKQLNLVWQCFKNT